MNPSIIPTPPRFSDAELSECKRLNDYCPVLFEWYKYVGSLVFFLVVIQRDSPALRSLKREHYFVLVGLLNRCARLMLANVALSHEGRFGETTAIVDRSIFETCLKIIWLCIGEDEDRFRRYFAEGLKADLEFSSEIKSNIGRRDDEVLAIEKRMLRSIENGIKASGLSEVEILATKKMPDVASMLSAANYNRLSYVVFQRMGSHHVHGTWASLLAHYLETDEQDGFRPRDHDCPTHINQYAVVAMFALDALTSYVRFILPGKDDFDVMSQVFDHARKEIMKVYGEAVDEDERRKKQTK